MSRQSPGNHIKTYHCTQRPVLSWFQPTPMAVFCLFMRLSNEYLSSAAECRRIVLVRRLEQCVNSLLAPAEDSDAQTTFGSLYRASFARLR